MTEDIKNYIEGFDDQTKQRFYCLYELIHNSTIQTISEKLWAKLPSFYVENKFVRVIPFKDHINIEAEAIHRHIHEITDYKLTPKGMLQIYHNQRIPFELLKVICEETLS